MAKPAYNPAAERQRLIRLIHVGKADIQMSDDAYRAVLSTISGGKKTSSAEMTIVELERVVSHLKSKGFKVRSKTPKGGASKPTSRRLAENPEATKIRALWLFLHQLGAVKNPSEAALAAYVKRIAQVDDLHWVSAERAERLIETLKKWAMRFLPAALESLVAQSHDVPMSDTARSTLAGRYRLALSRGSYDPMLAAYEAYSEALQGGAKA